jgi:hypothetical protein
MNRRHLIQSLALTAFATLITAGSVSAADITADAAARSKQGKRLKVGETLRYDSGLSVTFLAVKNDFRCPINAQCLTAGDAAVLLRVKAGKDPAKNVTIHTNRKPNFLVIPYPYAKGEAGIPKSYTIRIGQLNPLPYAGKKTLQSDYRLKLNITVAL